MAAKKELGLPIATPAAPAATAAPKAPAAPAAPKAPTKDAAPKVGEGKT